MEKVKESASYDNYLDTDNRTKIYDDIVKIITNERMSENSNNLFKSAKTRKISICSNKET